MAPEVVETDTPRRYRARTTDTRRLTLRVRADVAGALEQEAEASRRSQAAIVEELLRRRYRIRVAT